METLENKYFCIINFRYHKYYIVWCLTDHENSTKTYLSEEPFLFAVTI